MPNIPGRENLPNNFFFAPSEADDTNQYDVRTDHYLSDRQRLYGRYSQRNESDLQPGALPLPADGQGWQILALNGYNGVLNYSITLNPAMENEMRAGWTHFPGNYDLASHQNINQQLGIKGAPGDSFNDGLNYGMAQVQVAGYNQLGSVVNWPNLGKMDDLVIGDNLFWQRGKHSIKFGA